MHIIKLNAIDSTNSYLSKRVRIEALPDYSVVIAEEQLQGRGQRGSNWHSEPYKNLTFSILINPNELLAVNQFYMNMAVSLGLLDAIKKYVKSDFYIKWPNDILADKDKVAGILIENILNGRFVKQAIVGIGLNVNQLEFPETLDQVTSLMKLHGTTLNRDELLNAIISEIKSKMDLVVDSGFEPIRSAYMKALYKFEEPAMYQEKEGALFLGKIIDVNNMGQLCIQKEDGSISSYNFKDVKLLRKPS